jgi:hypothetical protein
MKALAPLLVALALSGCAEGRVFSEPPAQYRGDGAFYVVTGSDTAIERACAGAAMERDFQGRPKGYPVACAGGMAAIIPNPCGWATDPFAQLLCHEFGHLRGWRHAP